MKKIKIINRISKALLLYVILGGTAMSACEAQDKFSSRSPLGPVDQEGFYKIILMPGILATCKEDLSDLRIADSAGKYIPYVRKSDLPVFSSTNFLEFPIALNQRVKDSSTRLIIVNKSTEAIGSLLLEIKNYSAYRTAALSGSDDREKWFVIREGIVLEEANSNTRDYTVQSISFPAARYRYFKITIDDKGLPPVNIVRTGIYVDELTNGSWLGIPDPRISQKDSGDKHSYITLQYDASYFINRLDLRIKGPVFYKRKAWVYENGASGRRVAEIMLSPSDSSFKLSSVKSKQLLIEIMNEDNPPLVLQRAGSAQINQYLLCYLRPGKGYALLSGDSGALAPDYDLKYAADSLTARHKEILPGPPEKTALPTTGPEKQATGNKAWLWIILGLILAMLVFLSYKMIQSITQKDKR